MRDRETIYVYLLDEGTDVWRPVEALRIYNNIFRIVSPEIEGEKWQFKSGAVVRCREELSETNEPLFEAYELVRE